MTIFAIFQAIIEGIPVILRLLKSEDVQAGIDLLERLWSAIRGHSPAEGVLAHIREYDMEPFPPGDDDEDPLEHFGLTD